MIEPEIAKVKVPPNILREFLNAVTGAISSRGTADWAATREICRVCPTPTPVKTR